MTFSKIWSIFLLWSQNPQVNMPIWVRWVGASPFFQNFLKSLKHLEQFSYLCGLHMIKTRRATRSAKSSGLVTKNRILAIFWVKCIVFGFFRQKSKKCYFRPSFEREVDAFTQRPRYGKLFKSCKLFKKS